MKQEKKQQIESKIKKIFTKQNLKNFFKPDKEKFIIFVVCFLIFILFPLEKTCGINCSFFLCNSDSGLKVSDNLCLGNCYFSKDFKYKCSKYENVCCFFNILNIYFYAYYFYAYDNNFSGSVFLNSLILLFFYFFIFLFFYFFIYSIYFLLTIFFKKDKIFKTFLIISLPILLGCIIITIFFTGIKTLIF